MGMQGGFGQRTLLMKQCRVLGKLNPFPHCGLWLQPCQSLARPLPTGYFMHTKISVLSFVTKHQSSLLVSGTLMKAELQRPQGFRDHYLLSCPKWALSWKLGMAETGYSWWLGTEFCSYWLSIDGWTQKGLAILHQGSIKRLTNYPA